MAQQQRAPVISRARQPRFKVAVDENAISSGPASKRSSVIPSVAAPGPGGTMRPKLINATAIKTSLDKSKLVQPSGTRSLSSRAALGEINNIRKKLSISVKNADLKENKDAGHTRPTLSSKEKANAPTTLGGLKRRRSPSLSAATARPTRVPRPPSASAVTSTTNTSVTVTTSKVDGSKTLLHSTSTTASTTTSISAKVGGPVSGKPPATSTSTSTAPAPSDSNAPPRRLARVLMSMNAARQSQVIPPSSANSVRIHSKPPIQSDAPSPIVGDSSRPASPVPVSELVVEDEDGSASDSDSLTEGEQDHDRTEVLPRSRVVSESKSVREAKPDAPEAVFDLMEEGDWLFVPPAKRAQYQQELDRIKATFEDEAEAYDPSMVSEYAEEIFEYMSELEGKCMPQPNYMDGQQEINWDMRATLVDWLLQVHLRYHMLPETLWIAINIIDRFLSKRVVSVVKLQLVGVTAMFIAAKYEEIIAPGVDEYVKMTEGGYKKEEILKGEKIILQTIDFRISSYCSPYSWVRKISKADDYDLQTRTLCKFLMEVTLLDHRFLRVKPSHIAAIGMYSARKMLGNDWTAAFVFYSGRVEEELMLGHEFIIEQLAHPDFDQQYIYKKYTSKRFLKASVYATDWARQHHQPPAKQLARDKRVRVDSQRSLTERSK